MAFKARRVFPNDLIARKAIGINLPFNGDAVFIQNYETRDAIKYNLINYLLTNPGERIGNPSFGAGLRGYIFSQVHQNNLDFIKEDIQEKINDNFSNILLKEVLLTTNPDLNQITISITYDVPHTGISDELVLNFS